MRWLVLLFIPFSVVAQPKKATVYGKKISLPINDSLIAWKSEEKSEGTVFIGDKILTIRQNQYDIDSATQLLSDGKTIYTYFLSRKGKKFRCFVYQEGKENEWELLFDNSSSMVIYKLYE